MKRLLWREMQAVELMKDFIEISRMIGRESRATTATNSQKGRQYGESAVNQSFRTLGRHLATI